ncbi:M9 family metallopeptidase [Vibrio cholerae]|nr:M9 family metallopeptidase [Vibrio cholerae]EKF9842391.1 M9 family metallopeptidase [Vibrio cholerae]
MSFQQRIQHHPIALACVIAGLSYSSYSQAACEIQDLQPARDLPAQIAVATQACYNSWFYAPTSTLDNLYSEASLAHLQTVLDAEIARYTGEAQQARRLENYGEFIRAAYYVRYNAGREPYSQALSQRFAQSINRFLRHPHAFDQGREQVGAMKSLSLMVDNIKQLPLTMDAMILALHRFTRETAQDTQWVDGLNNLFRAMSGHVGNSEFYRYLAANTQHIDTLYRFALDNEWALETDAEFLVYNALRETGRLLISPDAITKQKARHVMRQVIARYPLGSKHDKLWLAAVEMLHYYAPEVLQQLGIDLDAAKRDLAARILPNRFECQGPAIIRSQDLSDSQAAQACDVLDKKEQDFHQVANTGLAPVADDYNTRVEVVVFANNSSYVNYSSFLFGNTTDNGGQYLEGNPADQNNQARFVAYRYANDADLSILNLEHEYTHYLDARFNQYGSFSDNLAHGHIVWWLEGFAEYMHYKQGYQAAVELISQGKLSLSDVFATTYSNDTNRIYRWGYLAVRFMLEKHPQDVESLLALSRTGQFDQWAQSVKLLGERYNTEFSAWLDTLQRDNPDNPDNPEQPNPEPNAVTQLAANSSLTLTGKAYSEHLFYVDVPEYSREFHVQISGEGDADLYMSYQQVAHYYDYQVTEFTYGSNEQITFKPEQNGYIKPGRYYLSVTGRADYSAVILNTHLVTEQPNEQPTIKDDLAPVVLEAGNSQSLTVHRQRYVAIYVPKGVSEVQVWLTASEQNRGNVDLFAAKAYWPTREQFEHASTCAGSHEYMRIPVTQEGYVHFSLNAQQLGDTVEMVAYFD